VQPLKSLTHAGAIPTPPVFPGNRIRGVTLIPGTGGAFNVSVDGAAVWSRKQQGRFPEIKELKRLVRDRVAPDKDLGHTER
jgi:selenoprotein W-related protein